MGWKAELRAREAAQNRALRDAQRRQRELERLAAELAKLSAQEQARLEVETYENRLEVLLSIHKQRSESWNWRALAASLSPPPPRQSKYHETIVRYALAVLPESKEAAESRLQQARVQDDHVFAAAQKVYLEELADAEEMRIFAPRIISGEAKAYTEALVKFNTFNEISDLGSSIRFVVHSATLIECILTVNGRQVIPHTTKTLTATGKLSVKPMAKARFHEIYQDYLCACVLRTAREVFALLPVQTLIITATAETLDTATGKTIEQPVLSVALPRSALDDMDFERLDPSDSLEKFLHRGDLKLSRKSESFASVTPLTLQDLPDNTPEDIPLRTLLEKARYLRKELILAIDDLSPTSKDSTTEETEHL